MTAFSKPLIALSLTDADEGLLRYAAVVARWLGWTDVLFVHVAEGRGPTTTWDPGSYQERLRAEVERLFGQPTPQCRPSYHALHGSRLDQLLKLAAQQQCDLIMLGHRRARSGRRSTARRLAMVAPCSVWLVPEGSAAQISNVLVPTDFSSHSADALAVAAQVARAVGLAQLHAVHVFFDPSMVRYEEHVDEVLGQEDAAFEKFLSGVDTQGVQVAPVFEESTHPADAILRVAERLSTDLIVMNTRGRSRAASVLLGSTTSDTMAATTGPLLVVKHYGDHLSLLEALLNHRTWEHGAPKTN